MLELKWRKWDRYFFSHQIFFYQLRILLQSTNIIFMNYTTEVIVLTRLFYMLVGSLFARLGLDSRIGH